MKKAIVALMVAGLMSMSLTALGSDGSYPECIGSPLVEGRLADTLEHRDDGAIRIGTVGSFLIVSYNNTGPRGMILGDVLSVELPEDAVAVEACLDGNVTFTFAPVEAEAEEVEAETQTINIIEFWSDWGYEMGLMF